MYRILKIGLDVHTTNYTICAVEPVLGQEENILARTTVGPDYKNIVDFIKKLKKTLGVTDKECDIQCGYEAGCLGYSLYESLTNAGIKCVILAPTTMLSQQGKRIKTDKRDALLIAKCLCYGGYHAVHIPTSEDNAVKEYLWMRDDHKIAAKKIKQQLNAFCIRHGLIYEGNNWTGAHRAWLKAQKLDTVNQETLNEYIVSLEEAEAKVARFDKRIEEIAAEEKYVEKVKALRCFLGIETHTALSLVVETGDFNRFAKGNIYAAYLGLAPGEHSSSTDIKRLGITKAGNSHLRKLLIEGAGGICKGIIGYKSKALRARQEGNTAEIIAYADKANVRMRSRYYHYIHRGKKRNVAVAAVARELACFIWGMMTKNISPSPK